MPSEERECLGHPRHRLQRHRERRLFLPDCVANRMASNGPRTWTQMGYLSTRGSQRGTVACASTCAGSRPLGCLAFIGAHLKMDMTSVRSAQLWKWASADMRHHRSCKRLARAEQNVAVAARALEVLQAHRGAQVPQLLLLPPPKRAAVPAEARLQLHTSRQAGRWAEGGASSVHRPNRPRTGSPSQQASRAHPPGSAGAPARPTPAPAPAAPPR